MKTIKGHFLPLLYFIGIASAYAQVEVPRAVSPGGEFSIMMETDKDQKEYDVDSSPKMWIEDTRSKKKLVEFEFGADPSSDMEPLRTNTKVLWSASGDAVAIQFQERFYSHLTVFRLEGTLAKPEFFERCTLPEDVDIIRLAVPRFKEFRSRWFQHPEAWIDKHTLIYTAGAGAILEPIKADSGEDVSFVAGYRFYVDFKAPKTPIIRRMEYVGENQ